MVRSILKNALATVNQALVLCSVCLEMQAGDLVTDRSMLELVGLQIDLRGVSPGDSTSHLNQEVPLRMGIRNLSDSELRINKVVLGGAVRDYARFMDNDGIQWELVKPAHNQQRPVWNSPFLLDSATLEPKAEAWITVHAFTGAAVMTPVNYEAFGEHHALRWPATLQVRLLAPVVSLDRTAASTNTTETISGSCVAEVSWPTNQTARDVQTSPRRPKKENRAE